MPATDKHNLLISSFIWSHSLKLLKEKTIISFLYVTFYSVILYGYYSFIVPVYGYMGYEWYPESIKIIEGVAFSLCIPYALRCQFERPSDLFLHFLLIFPLMPMIVLYGASGASRLFFYYSVVSYLLIVLIVRSQYIKIKPIRTFSLSLIFFQKLLLCFAWIIIFSIILQGGLDYLNFYLSRVYEFRSAAAENLPAIYGYLSSLTTKIILPFSFLLAVFNRDKFSAILSVAGSVMMFALINHKAPLFYPIAVLLLYVAISSNRPIFLFVIGNIFLIVLSTLLSLYATGFYQWIGGTFILRRVYMVPALLNSFYYDFFSTHDFMFWAHSKVTFGLLENPYNARAPFIISGVYFNNPLGSANTGWFGSGYMNAGFAGMIIYATIIGMLLSLLDEYSHFLDKNLITAIVLAPMFAIAQSTDLTSGMLNHGMLLSLLFFSMFSSKKIE